MATITTSNGGDAPDTTQPQGRALPGPHIPVSQNGCFEIDRVIKSGKVQKRAQKTRAWRTVYLVLRPNTLSIYKRPNEEKLRHKIYLSDLTAAAPLRDAKNRREHLFGLFLSSRNFHFQADSEAEAEEWLRLIREEARIDEGDEGLFLGSPHGSRQSSTGATAIPAGAGAGPAPPQGGEWLLSSSPECMAGNSPGSLVVPSRHMPQAAWQPLDWSGLSGNELASHSDFSDHDVRRPRGVSTSVLTSRPPPHHRHLEAAEAPLRPSIGNRAASPGSGGINPSLEQELDRVVWQGRLLFLRGKGGVRQWRKTWGVLRPRNLILYRDESEYAAKLVVPLPAVVDAVDVDPVGKARRRAHCFQVITEEKNYRFCAPDEESLVQCLGAFKSLLTKRRELEGRVAAAAAAAASTTGTDAGAGASGGTGTAAVVAAASTGATTSPSPPAMLNMSTSPPPPPGAPMVLPIR